MKSMILIVDDEPKMARAVATALQRSGHSTLTAASAAQALELMAEHGADVVVSDRRMPGMDGMELLRRLRARWPELPVILITAYGEVRSAVEAMRQGAFDYITKPFDNDELRGQVERALELGRLRRENALLRREVGARFAQDLVAESPAMRQVLELVDRAAPSDASVLIQGESGTGKEVVAKRLHFASTRVGRPFVAVNCKAFAAGVLESELFGHEKGAFTGATTRRLGCFERAHGGTLFLDEIGEIGLEFQAKLLRVLPEGELQRVGGAAAVTVDVRIVAATNRDLAREMAAERFREDLFYRLNVIPVFLPPLRKRQEDILPLARAFLARQGEKNGRPLDLTADASELLLSHPWPGNARELANAVERAAVLARGDAIAPEDLLLKGLSPSRLPKEGAEPGTLQEAMDKAAAERIRQALQDADGHRAEAAQQLGVDRTTLFRWIRKLEI